MTERLAMTDWTIVVPFRGSSAKSRFGPGDNFDLALAMALDTVEVALTVGRVIAVTTDATAFAALGATVVPDPGAGLNPALSWGLDIAGSATSRAVLLGDHPALTSDELADALRAAAGHPLAFVADAEGAGSALCSAAPHVPLTPLFGVGSARAHRSAGFVELTGHWPGLRRDVDTPEQLAALASLGRHTRAVLAGQA
jgi:2-phospho-L-lactate guanylyltransferase